MLQQKEQQEALSNWYDSKSVYGWISIFLHWSTAIIVITLWFIGKGIASGASDDVDAQRQLHVSLATSAWLLVFLRIVWRVRAGHPHVKGQTMLIHRIARLDHYAILAAVSLMLLSGPMIVWSGGNSIGVFSWFSIPGPTGESEPIQRVARFVHANSALLLLWLVLLHIGGALKHLMFHSDDTIARMIWPGRKKPGANE